MFIWRPALQSSFAGMGRQQVHMEINRMNRLRNRIAHHVPIYDRDLNKDYDTILKMLTRICPDAHEWVEEYSRVREVLAQRESENLLKF